MTGLLLYIICGVFCTIELFEYVIIAYLLGKLKKRFYSRMFKTLVITLQVLLGVVYLGFISFVICLFIGFVR